MHYQQFKNKQDNLKYAGLQTVKQSRVGAQTNLNQLSSTTHLPAGAL